MQRIIILIATTIVVATLFYFYKFRCVVTTPEVSSNFHFQPIPEFAPTDTIVMSEYLLSDNTLGAELAKVILKADVNLLFITEDADVDKLIVSVRKKLALDETNKDRVLLLSAPHESYWLRDFGPQTFLKVQNDKSEAVFFDFIYREESRLDDTIPYMTGMYLSKSVFHIPIALDGGNFMTNGEDCLLTDDFDKRFLLDERSSQELAEKLLKENLGCKNIHLFDSDAHEHIDMWAKFVSKDTILVNEIRPEIIELAEKNSIDLKDVLRVQKSLDRSAAKLEKFYKVKRVPMPLPYDGQFRTYLNSIIVNRHVIVPQFMKQYVSRKPYLDRAYFKKYESEVKDAFEWAGFKAIFVNSDYLISNGGSFHCVTSHIPRIVKTTH